MDTIKVRAKAWMTSIWTYLRRTVTVILLASKKVQKLPHCVLSLYLELFYYKPKMRVYTIGFRFFDGLSKQCSNVPYDDIIVNWTNERFDTFLSYHLNLIEQKYVPTLCVQLNVHRQ